MTLVVPTQSTNLSKIEQSISQTVRDNLHLINKFPELATNKDVLYVNRVWSERKNAILVAFLGFIGILAVDVLFRFGGLVFGSLPLLFIYTLIMDPFKIDYTLVVYESEIILIPVKKRFEVVRFDNATVDSISLNIPMNKIIISAYSSNGRREKLSLISNYFRVVRESGYVLLKTEFANKLKQRDKLIRKYGL